MLHEMNERQLVERVNTFYVLLQRYKKKEPLKKNLFLG